MPHLPDGHRVDRRRRSSHAGLPHAADLQRRSWTSPQAGIWGSLATWEDSNGTRWVLTPFWGPKHSEFKAPIEHGEVKKGAIAAFKMEDEGRQGARLTPAWISRDMNQAEPPLIANGMVFAYGSGENTAQAYPDVGLDFRMERRIPLSTHAVLYALDAQTGKELWSSGNQIATWNHWSGLALANGQVYINTYDGHAVLLRH